MTTIFKKIIDKEIPSEIVYEDNQILSFKDINPRAPLHFLVIPKEEIPTLNDIEEKHDKLIGKIVRVASELAKKENIADDGYRLVLNCNKNGGQEVYHLHFHLLGGRELNWPPG